MKALPALIAGLLCATAVRAQLTLADALDAPNLVWTTGGGAVWSGQTNYTHDGTDAVGVPAFIPNNQESWLQTSVTGPGKMAFWWKVSSEADSDILEFQTDGVRQGSISGEVNWQRVVFSVAAGTHTLRWRYAKDIGVALGLDRAWVDEVVFLPDTGPPVVLAQPIGRTVIPGVPVTFSVSAGGAQSLTYQWFLNDTNVLPGATNATFTVASAQISDTGLYSVAISNAAGFAASSNAMLNVVPSGPGTTIILHFDGEVSRFSAALIGMNWPFSGSFGSQEAFEQMLGRANPSNTVAIIESTDYRVNFGSLIPFVEAGGRAILQYFDWGVNPALAEAFDVAAVQQIAGNYQVYDWGSPFFSGVSSPLGFSGAFFLTSGHRLRPISDGDPVAGFASTVTADQAASVIGNGGRTIASGFLLAAGPTTASTRLARNQLSYLAQLPPVLVSGPSNQVVVAGRTASLPVRVRASEPIFYQWRKGSDAIPGGTNATFTIPNVQASDSGNYSVVVSNAYGVVISGEGTLTVVPTNPPVDMVLLITTAPTRSACEDALIERGQIYQRYTNFAVFATALAAAPPPTTLAVVDMPNNLGDFTTVLNFVGSGGRVLLQYWDLGRYVDLAATFEVSAAQFTSPQSVYDWGGSSFFADVLPPLYFVDRFNVSGAYLQPTGGGQAVAGFFTTAPVSGQAAIVIANSGRTIVNGFLIEEAQDTAAATRLIHNELEYLVGPPPSGPPFIVTQPAGRAVLVGDTVTVSIRAGGTPLLSYQWYKDQTALTEANNSSYTIASATPAHAGAYSVVVENAYGSATSGVATVTIESSLPPVSQILLFADWSPSPYRSALNALGRPYQWFTDPAIFNTAVSTSAPLTTLVVVDAVNFNYNFSTLPAFVSANGRAILQYFRLASDSGLASAFGVSVPQAITSPLPVYDWGGWPFFTGVASPLAMVDSFGIDGQKLQPIDGSYAAAGFVACPAADEAAVVVGNFGRTVVNGFLLEEAAATNDAIRIASNEIQSLLVSNVVPAFRPVAILMEPADQFAIIGSNATFSVIATGAPLPNCQWFFNQTNRLAGATAASLVVSNVQATDSGLYSVVLSNAFGALTSRFARLEASILLPPRIIATAGTLMTNVVNSTFSVGASIVGYPPPFFWIWKSNSTVVRTNITSASNDFVTFRTPTNVPASFIRYRLEVTNLFGTTLITASNLVFYTNYIVADADADGLPDIYETAYGAGTLDPLADADGDGMNNREEYIAGTNPTNAASALRITSLLVGTPTTLGFDAVSNKTYTVQHSSTLASNSWTKLTDLVARPTDRTETVTDSEAGTNRYYRVVTPRQP